MLIKRVVTTVKILKHIESTEKRNLLPAVLIKAAVTTVNILQRLEKTVKTS